MPIPRPAGSNPHDAGPAANSPQPPEAEAVDEYNWINTSVANGGSGICTANPATSTCIAPLDPANGFNSYLVPLEADATMRHVTANDPRPHYAHQSNLAEDRILYPVIDEVLRRYRAGFSSSAPVVQLSMRQAGLILSRQATWASAQSSVTAFVRDGVLWVGAPDALDVPVTVPAGTKVQNAGSLFGEGYGGERSAWLPVSGELAAVARLKP